MSGRCLNRFEQRAINALVLAMVDLDTMPDVLEQQLEACANLLRCSVAQVTVACQHYGGRHPELCAKDLLSTIH